MPVHVPHTDAMSNKDVAYHMAFHLDRQRSLRVPKDDRERERMTRRHTEMHGGNSRTGEVASHVHGGVLSGSQFG